MKERPIIFSGEMVRAILGEQKTMTRRPAKKFFLDGEWADCVHEAKIDGYIAWWGKKNVSPEFTKKAYDHGFLCPYGIIGDRLWVRETWVPGDIADDDMVSIIYKASDDIRPDGISCEVFGSAKWFVRPEEEVEKFHREIQRLEVYGDKWKPSIYMPRWASRITLEITNLKVEKLQDITEEDAIKEGVADFRNLQDFTTENLKEAQSRLQWTQRQFRYLWDSIYFPPFCWDDNPYVWVIEFKRIL